MSKTATFLKLSTLVALALAALFAPLPTAKAAPAERVFRIQASRFAYDPGIIQVNPGDRVTIELEATDVVHGLSIDGYRVQTTADPGQVARVTFTADRTGSFRFRCNITCGNMHPFMIGKLHVGQNSLLLRSLGLALVAVIAGIFKLWK
jgi:heme/copper-type cytochrome/quinol oxidase subunit 2